MKSTNRFLLSLAFAGGLVVAGAVAHPAVANAAFQQPGPDAGDIRGLVDRTQTDLRAAADQEVGGEESHKRYRTAQKDLSVFDRHLTKGHFDKEALGNSISDIQGILDHNTLQASTRDMLLRDVGDLRVARDRRY